MLDSTQHYQDARGYDFTGMSESWKTLCLKLPCSDRVQIPPVYAQAHIEATIGGEAVLIQAWKGDCPHLASGLPGGIGGEVGIYRRDKDRVIPQELDIPDLAAFPPSWHDTLKRITSELIRRAAGAVETPVDHWWPYPLATTIEMSFSHGDGGNPFFTATPTEPPTPGAAVYWMSRWMSYGSYAHYAVSELFHGRLVPARAQDYVMDFTVGGVKFRWQGPSIVQLP